MGIELNAQQINCANKALLWWRNLDKQVFTITGYAGTGKTTIIKYLMQVLNLQVDEVLFMSFTGKASLVLSRKGNYAKTIHSTIYKLEEVVKLDENGNPIKHFGRTVKELKFIKRDEIPKNIKLLVIDEASMVNEAIGKDILSFNVPIIALGDLNQIPPVFGEPYFLHQPDYNLTKIMRQAENDPIVHLATMARLGQHIDFGVYGGKCFVIPQHEIRDEMLTSADIILCGKNKTREEYNNRVKGEILRKDLSRPCVGDKIICRQNNWTECIDDVYLVNGLIGFLDGINLASYDKKSIEIDFRPEFFEYGRGWHGIKMDYQFFVEPLAIKGNRRSFFNKFELGYAITTHLSQGSEYDNVFIQKEFMGDKEFMKKWLYTGITRARDSVTIAIPSYQAASRNRSVFI